MVIISELLLLQYDAFQRHISPIFPNWQKKSALRCSGKKRGKNIEPSRGDKDSSSSSEDVFERCSLTKGAQTHTCASSSYHPPSSSPPQNAIYFGGFKNERKRYSLPSDLGAEIFRLPVKFLKHFRSLTSSIQKLFLPSFTLISSS